MRACPRPLRPNLHISMMHWIVMNIIERRIKMSLRPNSPIANSTENLSSATAFFSIPTVRHPPVKQSQFAKQRGGFLSLNQRVIMIWQHTPRMHNRATLSKCLKQRFGEKIHPLFRKSDERFMLITRRRNVNACRAGSAAVRRTMPRLLPSNSPVQQLFSLCFAQPTPHIPRRHPLKISNSDHPDKNRLTHRRITTQHVVPPSGSRRNQTTLTNPPTRPRTPNQHVVPPLGGSPRSPHP